MATGHSPAHALATQLIALARQREGPAAGGPEGPAATAFHALSVQISRWLGAGGCQALVTRALRRAIAAHPALSEVRITSVSPPRLDRLNEAVEAHGAADVAAGLETLLVTVFELLGRLIGDELSTKLAELSMPDGVPDAAKSDPERTVE